MKTENILIFFSCLIALLGLILIPFLLYKSLNPKLKPSKPINQIDLSKVPMLNKKKIENNLPVSKSPSSFGYRK